MRHIGLDVHRDWCDVAISENGSVSRADACRQHRQAGAVRPKPRARRSRRAGDDRQRAEHRQDHRAARRRRATGAADTRNVRAMTPAKVKNDRVDARMIAKLLAARMLPGVSICDGATRVLRRRIARRTQLVRGRSRARNQIHATLIRNLGGRGPARDIPQEGREWLESLELPPMSARRSSAACAKPTSSRASSRIVDREIARYAVSNPEIRRLMTIPGN